MDAKDYLDALQAFVASEGSLSSGERATAGRAFAAGVAFGRGHPPVDVDGPWLASVGFEGDVKMRPNGPGMYHRTLEIALHHDGTWSWRGMPWPFRKVVSREDLVRVMEVLA